MKNDFPTGFAAPGRNVLLHDGVGWVLFFILSIQSFAQTQPPPPAYLGKVPQLSRPDRVLIKPKQGHDSTALINFHARRRARVLRTFHRFDGLQVIGVPEGVKAEDLIQQYQQSGLVEFAEPDYLLHASVVPNDPRYSDGTLWAMNNTGQSSGLRGADIDGPEGWGIRNSASNIVVAVIDSGIRYTHEDLAANMWKNPGEIAGNGRDDDGNGIVDDIYGINAVSNTGDPVDQTGHGTHVAGIIGAVGNNSKGVVGIAWKVQIMACKFMDSTGVGSTSDAIQCIDYARAKGAQVINASWGGPDNSSSLRTAISRARSSGIIFVTAAGNESADNDRTASYPANYDIDNIVSVAGTTRTDILADYSNFGAVTVDLAAPGSAIYSTWFTSNTAYSYLSGTSMAAPHVAGVFALMAAQYPNDTYKQLIDRVLAATDSIPSLAGKCVTAGRINLYRSLGPGLIANFSASATIGSPPLTVTFADASVGTITSRSWDFGDNTPQTSASSPTHVFNSEGTFNVMLTLTGTNGISSTKTRAISVVANYRIVSTNLNWIDPSNMTRLTLTDNGVSAAQRLPFPFAFYGQTYEQFYVGANGVIGFINQGLTTTSNTDLPAAAAPNAIICPYWDNLNPAVGGSVRVGIVGTTPNRRVVISWVSVQRNSTANTPLTFQTVLHESSRKILFQYLEVQPANSRGAGRAATVGIENETGLVGAKYTFNGSPAVLANNHALLFVPSSSGGMTVTPVSTPMISGPAGGSFFPDVIRYTIENKGTAALHWFATKTQDWLNVSPTSGSLMPGQSATVTITIAVSARQLKVGSYSDVLYFVNQDSGLGNTTRTVNLAVNGTTGVLTISPDSGLSSGGPSGGPFNPSSQIYTLVNTGDAGLTWTASKTQNWLTLSASSGTLAAGDSTTVTVLVNSTAAELVAGRYEDTVEFVNTPTGLGNTKKNATLIVQAPQTARLNLEATAANGAFVVRLFGEAGKSYTFESSTDLQTWTIIRTETAPADGVIEFSDFDLERLAQKFFRAVAAL